MNSRVSIGFAAATVVLFLACSAAHAPSMTGGKGGQGGAGAQSLPDAFAGAGGGAAGGGGGGVSGGGGAGQGGQTTHTEAGASGAALGGASNAPGSDAGAASGRDSTEKDAGVDPSVGNPRTVLVCDEGNRKVVLLDLQNTGSAIWSTQLSDPTKYGDSMRDLQLVGGGRVAVSTAKGYVELDLKTGDIKKEVSRFTGVESLRRLPNGNTVLGSNGNGGVTLQELDSQDAPVAGHTVTFTNFTQLRMLRRTPQATFLLGVGNKLAEVNWDKQTLWEMGFTPGAGHDLNYMYQGLRLPDATIAVTAGYAASILIVDPKSKTVKQTIGGKGQPDAATIVPNFYGGYQILPNGHFVVSNWEGHGGGNGGTGLQLLEYDPQGLLVWKWKQNASLVSSLHNVLVLDGLDTSKLHDDVSGVLAPVTQ